MVSQSVGAAGMGILAAVLGAGGIAAALRTRRHRAGNPEAYASAGGIFYTVAQIGCSGLLLVGGAALAVIVLVTGR